MDLKKLKGKRIFITGASSGIGSETALEFAMHGCRLALNYHSDENEANDLLAKICNEVKDLEFRPMLLKGDVALEADVLKMFDTISKEWGGLDILVNNAGIQIKRPSHEVEMSEFMKVFTTNAIGTFLCSREALKLFLLNKTKGIIINNTSVHQLIPKPMYLSYSMSKGAVENLTKTLALEYAKYGIRVNNVAPGAIETPINSWAKDENKKSKIREHIPMKKIGCSEEIAKVMVFLASTDSDYITGQTIFVDGGLSLYPDFAEDWSSS